MVHKLYGSTPEAQEAAEAEFITMAEAIKAELLTKSHNIADLWATRAMLHRTLVSVGVQIFGQFTGINGKHSISTFTSISYESSTV